MKIIALIVGFLLSAQMSYTFLGERDNNVLLPNAEVLSDTAVADNTLVSLTPTMTLTPTQTPTPSLTPTIKITQTPTLTPTPSPIPQPDYTSEQINGFIDRFAGQYGVDPHVLRRIAICESGFNPKAVNGTYGGLYQFSPSTWRNNRILMGEDTDANLRFNAEEAAQTAAYMFSIGKGYSWPNCTP